MMYKLLIIQYFLFVSIIITFCHGVNVDPDDVKKSQVYLIMQAEGPLLHVLCGATLISEHITLTTANDISDKGANYHVAIFENGKDIFEAFMSVIFYDYQQGIKKNNFGLLIFRHDLTTKGIIPALLLNPNENIEMESKTFVTGLNMKVEFKPTLHINDMKRTKCKSEDNDQIICNIMVNTTKLCMITESGAMFKQVERIGGQSYYVLGGIVIQPAKLCDRNDPALVLRTNVQNVFKWIQGMKQVKH